jgi:hypothetical protein
MPCLKGVMPCLKGSARRDSKNATAVLILHDDPA